MDSTKFHIIYKFLEDMVEDDEDYQCKYCLKEFDTIKQLRIHSVTEHTPDNRLVCNFCYREYKIKGCLIVHLRTHMHIPTPPPQLRPREQEQNSDYSPEPETESEESDYSDYTDRGYKVKKPDREYPRQCDHCTYEVPMASVHYHHYLFEHPGIKYPYSTIRKVACPKCGALVRRSNWRDHEMKHSGIKIKCTECDKVFQSIGRMKKHRGIVHRKDRLVCDFCGKGFKTRIEIVRHIRIHTGEKPFKCHICGAGFAHSGNRLVHIRSAHQNCDRFQEAPKKGRKTSKKTQPKKQNKRGRKKNISKVPASESDDETLSEIAKKKRKKTKK